MPYKMRYFPNITHVSVITTTKTYQLNATEPTANANSVSANSGGGESTNIFALIFDETLVTNSRSSLLPCKIQSRTVYYPLAIHCWNNDLTKSVTDFQDPLTRTHHPLPPYCLSSLPRSSYHTKHTVHTLVLTALIGQHKGVRFIFVQRTPSKSELGGI